MYQSVFTKFYRISAIYLFLIIYCCLTTNCDKLINEFVVKIPNGFSEAKGIATQMGFILDHKMLGFDDLFVFKYKIKDNNVNQFFRHRLRRSNKVDFVDQQVARKRVKRSASYRFIDPLYPLQWYLMRSQLNPNEADMNVIEAWNLGYTGKGVVVSILDDGIDYRHPDLKDNYDPMASYDINGGDNDPLANFNRSDNRHGTRCAGEVVAKANNSQCGVGIAFNSKIGAVRMLDGEVTDRVEAEALSLRQQYIDIFSGSWGPDDNGQRVEGPARLAKAAFEKGVKYGRNGLGNIYVWASGNGGNMDDSCACDGYASSIYTLSVSSVSERNLKPWYLESCASTLISTYSSGGIKEKKIISTDLNFNCALDHTGTSASAPLAAGIIALLLEANHKLTWRDVQYITVVTANTSPFIDANFIVNGANRKVSNLYGFGLMDTGKMVRLGKLWQSLPPQHVCTSTQKVVNRPLNGIFDEKVSMDIDGCSGNMMVNYVEHVILFLSLEYQRRGDLQVFLISPAGTRSELLPFRTFDSHSGAATFDKWPLMSVQFWGERSAGKWYLEVRNVKSSAYTMHGILLWFSLTIYGTDKWPMRLRAPASRDTDNWFQQFERYVVNDNDTMVSVQDRYSRGHADTSNKAFMKANIECHDQCLNNTCNGWGPRHCISCKRYQTHSGECVKECPLGTYLNLYNRICELCHFSCDECNGVGKYNCTRCHVGDSFDVAHRQCEISLKGCPEEFYKDIGTCAKCPNNCSVCQSNTQCSQCKSGFVLSLNSQCKLSCDLGSYPDWRSRCRVCHIDCVSCINGNPSDCTSCKHGYLLQPVYLDYEYGYCISECTLGYYTNRTSGVCSRCHPNCKTCIGPSTESCTDCIPPLELSETGHTCIDPVSYNCKPDEYKTVTGRCIKCPVQCKTCSDDRCTSCYNYRRFLFNNTCTEICPPGHFSVTKDNICLPCRSFCEPCYRDSQLPECSDCGIVSNQCGKQCNSSAFWDSGSKSCKRCHSLCVTCTGAGVEDCVKCSQSTYLMSSHGCVTQCPLGQRTFISGGKRLCIPCHSSCLNSSCDPDSGRCSKCPIGHKLSDNGHCARIITCPMNYYWQANTSSCHYCHQRCRSCSEYGPCSSCPRNHCLQTANGSCQPCCSPLSSIEGCFRCQIGREFCGKLDLGPYISQLLIFRYPIRVVMILVASILLLFAVIMAGLYRKPILEAMKQNHSYQSSMKYTKLRNYVEHRDYLENDDDRDGSDNESVLFQNYEKLSHSPEGNSDIHRDDCHHNVSVDNGYIDNGKVNGANGNLHR